MTNEDAVKWIKNLKDDIGTHHHASLWHYEQALCEIIELLKEQKTEIDRLKSEKANAIEQIENEISRLNNESKYANDEIGIATYNWLINGFQASLDIIKDGGQE